MDTAGAEYTLSPGRLNRRRHSCRDKRDDGVGVPKIIMIIDGEGQ